MSRIFLSHHHSNNREALALKLWLESQGWRDEIFLDFDPEAGIKTGTRWKDALVQAGERCEAIICLTSPGWVGSPECQTEYRTAEDRKKKIFVTQLAELGALDKTSEWQGCRLFGDGPVTEIPLGPQQLPVRFLTDGLVRLKLGLLEAGISRVLPKHFPWPPDEERKRDRYRGLEPLEFVDAGVYFGRDAEILHGLAELERMRLAGNTPLFVILGASGAGKSSFLRAGLLPRLKRDDRHFFPLDIVRPDRSPLFGDSGLAHAIASANAELELKHVNAGQVKAEIKKGPGALSVLLRCIQEAVRARLVRVSNTSVPPTLVLPVDQAEELFNADATEEAQTFLNMIGGLLRGDPDVGNFERITMIVAFTIRSDRYELLQTASELRGLGRVLFDDLRPMHPAQFKEVITGPAGRKDRKGRTLEIKPDLVNRLVSDCTSTADTLPLLGLILARLSREHGSDGELQLDEYLAMGELADVIRTEAESVLSNDQDKREEQLRHLRAAFFPFLVRMNPDNGEPMRRVARMSDLPVDSRLLIEAFIEKRLLLSDLRNGEPIVEVAHESLFRQWNVLSDWLRVERESLREADCLQDDAQAWKANGKKEEWLRRGERLTIGETLASTPAYQQQLESVREFLKISRESEDKRHESELRIAREKQEAAERLEKQFRQAIALRLNAEAQAMLSGTRPGGTVLGLLKLLGAHRIAPHHQIEGAMLDALLGLQRMEKIVEMASQITAVAFSSDGTKVASGDAEGTLQLQDTQTGQLIRKPLKCHGRWVWRVVFSPDDSNIMAGCADGTLRIWNLPKGQLTRISLNGHTGEVTAVGFSLDGSKVVYGYMDGTLQVWNVRTGQQIARSPKNHKYQVMRVIFSPDGTKVLSGGAEGTLRVWEVQSEQLIEVWLKGHEYQVCCLAFSADGSKAVSGGNDGTIRIWNLQTGQPIVTCVKGHKGMVTSVAFSPDGSRVVSIGADLVLWLWDALAGQPIAGPLKGHNDDVWNLTFSNDGNKIVSGDVDGTLRVWSVQVEQQIKKLPSNSMCTAFNSDCSKGVSGYRDGTLLLWDVQAGEQIGMPLQGHESTVTEVAFSPDGTKVVSGGSDGTLRFWDVQTGEPSGMPFQGHEDSVQCVAFSPDGTKVVSGGSDRTLRFWDVQTGEPIGPRLTSHKGTVYRVAFSCDGSKVVSGHSKGLLLWEVRAGQTIGVSLRGHEDGVTDVTFSPDGTKVVSSGNDKRNKTVRLWDVLAGQPLGAPIKHNAYAINVAFSLDGTQIILANYTGVVGVLPAPKMWLDLLCAKLTRNMSRKEWREHVSPDIEYIEQCPGLPIPDDEPEQQSSANGS